MKKVIDFSIPVDKNNVIFFSHYINITTYTICTMNPNFSKEKLWTLDEILKTNWRNNIAWVEAYKPSQKELTVWIIQKLRHPYLLGPEMP